MSTFQFIGSGTLTEAFNIDHALVSKPLLPGEVRLRTSFPYPTLDGWRRSALMLTAATPTTGSSDIATRGRTTLLFAHSSDLAGFFFDLVGTEDSLIAGYYVDQLKAQIVDVSFTTILSQRREALAELKQQNIPEQFVGIMQTHLEGPSFNHRVAGVCASVYLTSIILEQAQK